MQVWTATLRWCCVTIALKYFPDIYSAGFHGSVNVRVLSIKSIGVNIKICNKNMVNPHIPPPFLIHRYGNRQMFPRPTQCPTIVRMYSILLSQWPLLFIEESSEFMFVFFESFSSILKDLLYHKCVVTWGRQWTVNEERLHTKHIL